MKNDFDESADLDLFAGFPFAAVGAVVIFCVVALVIIVWNQL